METKDEQLRKLLIRLKDGDMAAFDEIYASVKRDVFYNIVSLVRDTDLAEEVLQDTFVAFLESLPDLDVRDNPLGYLFVISRNKALKALKQLRRNVDLETVTADPVVASPAEVRDDAIFRRMRALLSPREYRIVVLHVLEGLPHREIARMMKRPLGSVTWAYANAIKKLRKGLGDFHG